MEKIYDISWTWKNFLKFLAPSMFSMVILSLYTVVDGLFIARFAGADSLAALNIAFPFLNLTFGVVLMLSVGGTTRISILLGEKKKEEADQKFTLTLIIMVIVLLVLTFSGLALLDSIVNLLGASPRLAPHVRAYLFINLLFLVPFMIKIPLEYLMRADGVPGLTFIIMTGGGILNIILDYIFMGLLGMGITGAALGTALAGSAGGIVSLLYFLGSKSHLRFRKPRWDRRFLLLGCMNGSSEMVNDWSIGITTILFNFIILKRLGEAGVSAIGALFQLNFLMISFFLGTAMGFSPIISYYYGARDLEKLRNVNRKALITMLILSALLFSIFLSGRNSLPLLYDPHGKAFGSILSGAIGLYSFAFLFVGFNLYTSNYFTALGNGRVSAIIALSRSLVGVVIGILILPLLLGQAGIWLAVPFSEGLTALISLIFLIKDKTLRETLYFSLNGNANSRCVGER